MLRNLCDRLRATLLRARTPPCPACPAAAYAAVSLAHAQHPPSALRVGPDGCPHLLVNPSAWSPVDGALRSKCGGAAAAATDFGGSHHGGGAAGGTTRQAAHAGSDWDALAQLAQLVADCAQPPAKLTQQLAGARLGARLLWLHTARVLCDDAAARLAVFAAARPRVGREARQLYRSAQLYRLYDMAASNVFRTRFVAHLVAIIDAADETDATAHALEEEEEEEEAREEQELEMADAEGPPTEVPVAGDDAGLTPVKGAAAAQGTGGGIGFTPPPSVRPRVTLGSQASQAREAEAKAVSVQLSCSAGFPSSADAAHAAARMLGALLDLAGCAEGEGEWGAAAAGTRGAGGGGWRCELDDMLADCWLHGGRACPGGGANGTLLATLSQGRHALRLARCVVARGARVVDTAAAALRQPPSLSPAGDAAALLRYVGSHAPDVVRGQRCGGGAAAQGRAQAKAAFLVAHAVTAACVLDAGAEQGVKRELVQALTQADAALRATGTHTGLHCSGDAALRVAAAAAQEWSVAV